MPDDDPHVSRIIRTPHSTISIKGTLDEVDRVYRICSHALLDNGYGLKPPGESPWQNFDPPPEENADHLRRRLNDVERQLAESRSHEIIQTLRRELARVQIERDTWRIAFTDVDHTVISALKVLDRSSVREAIAIDILSMGEPPV